MPVPWIALARILKTAPLVLTAADALLERTRRTTTTAVDLDALRQRVTELEHHQQATATLAKELAEQASVVATAVQQSAARARQATIIAIVAAIVGLVALVFALR